MVVKKHGRRICRLIGFEEEYGIQNFSCHRQIFLSQDFLINFQFPGPHLKNAVQRTDRSYRRPFDDDEISPFLVYTLPALICEYKDSQFYYIKTKMYISL